MSDLNSEMELAIAPLRKELERALCLAAKKIAEELEKKMSVQDKNIAWFLPRPKPDKYKGGMPLHCEKWLVELAETLLQKKKLRILSLFSGANKFGLKVDIQPHPWIDLCCDAHKLSDYLQKDQRFDLIIADPPYSNDECQEIYNIKTKLNYKKWTSEADKFLKRNGLFCIYHKYVMPNPNPEKYKIEKRVFIGSRTYHVPRVALFFRKK